MNGTASFADRQMVSLTTKKNDMRLSSRALLKALLRYALNNDRDLGLGREVFFQRCRKHRVRR